MITHLKEKLRAYITIHHPDLLLSLQESYGLSAYLDDQVKSATPLVLELLAEDKPAYVIEELAMEQVIAPLRPSRFNYLKEILEEEFSADYERLRKAGVLQYELLNMLEGCRWILDNHPFNEQTEGDRFLRYAVIAKIHEYLN